MAGCNTYNPISSTCNIGRTDLTGLAVEAQCTGTPPTTANVFQHGCLITQTDSGTGTAALFQNVGSSAVPSWTLLETAAASLTLPVAASDAATTTGTSMALTMSTLTSGNGVQVTGSGATLTTGSLFTATMGAAVTGAAFSGVTTGVYTGLNGILQLTANSATTGTIARINGTGLTSGNGLYVVGGAGMVAGGNLVNADMGTGAAGTAFLAQTTGVYTDSSGLMQVVANNATTGNLSTINCTGLTTGTALRIGTSSLTTGRAISVGTGLGVSAQEMFGIGANGHIHTMSPTGAGGLAPTIVVTQQNGITAAALSATAGDAAGQITTTGTNNNGGTTILTVTFNKTYTTAPKAVILQPLNASAALAVAANGNGTFVSSISATAFAITIPANAAAGATPSWAYLVIA